MKINQLTVADSVLHKSHEDAYAWNNGTSYKFEQKAQTNCAADHSFPI